MLPGPKRSYLESMQKDADDNFYQAANQTSVLGRGHAFAVTIDRPSALIGPAKAWHPARV